VIGELQGLGQPLLLVATATAGLVGDHQIIQGEKQLRVPLYQRTYSWQEAQLRQLWDDVLDQADGLTTLAPGPTHFLGSIVLAPSPALGPAGVMKWIIVDGQQRLTTLMLAMCALRDHLAAGNPRERDRINELYLTNKWQSGLDFYRILPTQADREPFFACINRVPEAGGGDNIGAAYRFFRRELVAAADEEDPHDLDRIETVLRERLTLVLAECTYSERTNADSVSQQRWTHVVAKTRQR
jgi:Protein of unknown function DUF262